MDLYHVNDFDGKIKYFSLPDFEEIFQCDGSISLYLENEKNEYEDSLEILKALKKAGFELSLSERILANSRLCSYGDSLSTRFLQTLPEIASDAIVAGNKPGKEYDDYKCWERFYFGKYSPYEYNNWLGSFEYMARTFPIDDFQLVCSIKFSPGIIGSVLSDVLPALAYEIDKGMLVISAKNLSICLESNCTFF